MLGESEDFGAKEGEDVICDDVDRLIAKVCVVDAEVGVEPLDFVRNELTRDEALMIKTRQINTSRSA
jgi:hypothetical protein